MVSAFDARRLAREGRWRGSTRDVAPGHVQCNLVVLRGGDGDIFAEWCARNPNVAPILARSEPGDPTIAALGLEIDLRDDLPAYQLYSDGVPAEVTGSLRDCWTDDAVAFAFGCSFSLEEALRRGGVTLAYEARGFGGAIYQAGVETVARGEFAGPLIVSMRPIKRSEAALAAKISHLHPLLHGMPVQVGDAEAIGVDLTAPIESLGPVSIAADEVPVFWACGVTVRNVIARARPRWAATHVSSQMLVTDLLLDDLARPLQRHANVEIAEA